MDNIFFNLVYPEFYGQVLYTSISLTYHQKINQLDHSYVQLAEKIWDIMFHYCRTEDLILELPLHHLFCNLEQLHINKQNFLHQVLASVSCQPPFLLIGFLIGEMKNLAIIFKCFQFFCPRI